MPITNMPGTNGTRLSMPNKRKRQDSKQNPWNEHSRIPNATPPKPAITTARRHKLSASSERANAQLLRTYQERANTFRLRSP
mmetsp:Transcript_19727/g.55080  ORF Transcript_19727/g.55080 Transcript_19727/m.55080 type:complete len:82 (+) Transcript_19727:2391-2636(+)